MVTFYKMHGVGNKFVIYDLRSSSLNVNELNSKLLNNKLEDTDYDQKIILLNAKESDVFMKIYNIDGSEASACGNATRCVAYIISKEKNIDSISIETPNRILTASKITNSIYSVNMGTALLSNADIPLTKNCDPQNIKLLDEHKFGTGFALNVGNPHIVFFVKNINNISLKQDVAFLEKHTIFKEGVNINIAQIISNNQIQLKTWERGAGETKACGTGACATAYAAFHQRLITNQVSISMPGGTLEISISDDNQIFMSGETSLDSREELEL